MAITKLRSTIAGDPIYAKVAERDSAGNLICETYATKAEIPDIDVRTKLLVDSRLLDETGDPITDETGDTIIAGEDLELVDAIDNMELLARRTYEDATGNSLNLTIENNKVTAIGGKQLASVAPPAEVPTGFLESMRFTINGNIFEIQGENDETNTTPNFGGSWTNLDRGNIYFDANAGSVYEIDFDIAVQVITAKNDINNYILDINKMVPDGGYGYTESLVNSYSLQVNENSLGRTVRSSRCFVKFSPEDLNENNKYVLDFAMNSSSFRPTPSDEYWTIENIIITRLA